MNLKFEERKGLLFCLPALIMALIFSIYPLIKTIIYSFTFTNEKGKIVEFAGIENFYELFTDPSFYSSLIATFKFATITVVLSILIALFLAIICNEKIKGIGIFRTIFSSSLGVSISAAASIVLFMFHPSLGVINEIIKFFGGIPINWLTDSRYALITVAISTIWMNIGFGFLVLTAGLQNIGTDIDESCEIDGAGYFPKLFKITLPLLGPSIFYLVITMTLKAFQSFGQVDILTGGGPNNSTNFLVYSIYKTAYSNYRFDYASAQGVILLLIITAIMLIKFKFQKKVHYQ
ncbi:carbohydrate ABC transporter permease [Fusobacterium sp.]|uniref:carbohydrate ABC transporter permease n=1 Tax=Fusobacterium sp. TaxID=68766 RepID=UPI0025B7CD2D|nr:sugar ABC transporter permease [Fusobacterium sp.]